uniref:GATOR complex protein NPRL3 n=1 Tax=Macrostomum lignano TaxID=282301 RepID=A0A1I8FL59_9PLAT
MNAVVSGTDDKEATLARLHRGLTLWLLQLPPLQPPPPPSSDLLDSDAAAISSQFSLLVRTQPTCSSLHTANGNGAGNGSAGTGNQPEVTVCLRDEALASILSAKAVMTQRAFEIKVDDVVFLGYSESLAAGAVAQPPPLVRLGPAVRSSARKSAAGSSSISTFCIIFAVRCCAPKSINKLYIQLARQLTTALRHEEQRCKFLHAQQELINQLMAELEDARQQRRQILDRLNERSQLCRSLTSVFCQLRRGGRVSLTYHCVLPLTDYSSSSSNPLEAGANGGLTLLTPANGLQSAHVRFLRALSPQKSLLDIRLETDMPTLSLWSSPGTWSWPLSPFTRLLARTCADREQARRPATRTAHLVLRRRLLLQLPPHTSPFCRILSMWPYAHVSLHRRWLVADP